eukprot:TRINITY_DN6363_c0_g1_i1.p1 TRINITY_DN6363_c0_g1~~TRINITY_DN6363_c0_g1_i1.p1  ORF type:complete len:2476 (-),score=627.67 TRINITY_DN6363_c0_g1_i1:145-7572(-)
MAETLVVHSHGEYKQLSGVYEALGGTSANGFPVWKLRGGAAYFIFSSISGRWLLGDAEDAKNGFATESAALCSIETHEGRLPHEAGEWYMLSVDNEWVVAAEFHISLPPDAGGGRDRLDGVKFAAEEVAEEELPVHAEEERPAEEWPPALVVLSTVGYHGTYHLMRGRRANDWPVWKNPEGLYIFSSPAGRWMVGDEDEAADNFSQEVGEACTTDKHDGMLPHEMGLRGGWYVLSDTGWQEAPSFRVKVEGMSAPVEEDEAHETSEDESEEALLQSRPQPPRFLKVTLRGKEHQTCAGSYALRLKAAKRSVGENPNEYDLVNLWPLWAHLGGHQFLFSGADERWYFGDVEELEKQFKCEEGLYASRDPHGGVYPDEVRSWDVMARDGPFRRARPTKETVMIDIAKITQAEYDADCVAAFTKHAAQEDAAEVLQSRVRGRLERFKALAKREAKRTKQQRQAENEAAATIQARKRRNEYIAQARECLAMHKQDYRSKATKLADRAHARLIVQGTESGACDGEYRLRPGEYINNFQYWRNAKMDTWIFRDLELRWCFGTKVQEARNFAVRGGVYAAAGQTLVDSMPEEESGWLRYDAATRAWVKEPEVMVEVVDDRMEVLATKLQAGIRGKLSRRGIAAMLEGPAHLAVSGTFGAFDGHFAKECGLINYHPYWVTEKGDGAIYLNREWHWCLGQMEGENVEDEDDLLPMLAAKRRHKMPWMVPEGGWIATEDASSALAQSTSILSVKAVVAHIPQSLVVMTAGMNRGIFELTEFPSIGEYPVWRCDTPEEFLYSGSDGRWYVGDVRALALRFRCSVGLLVSREPHGGLLPHKLPPESWLECTAGSADLKDFVSAPDIRVWDKDAWAAEMAAGRNRPVTQEEIEAAQRKAVQEVREKRAKKLLLERAPERITVMKAEEFSGEYRLVHNMTANEAPLWEAGKGRSYLFATPKQHWTIADSSAFQAKFKVWTGRYITATPHDFDWLPTEHADTGWLRADESGAAVSDVEIRVLEVDTKELFAALTIQSMFRGKLARRRFLALLRAPVTMKVDGAGDSGGLYELVRADFVNGCAYWKRVGEEKERWLFSGVHGHWYIGDAGERLDDFRVDRGEVASQDPHFGKLPHEMPVGRWQIFVLAKSQHCMAPALRIIDYEALMKKHQQKEKEAAEKSSLDARQRERDELVRRRRQKHKRGETPPPLQYPELGQGLPSDDDEDEAQEEGHEDVAESKKAASGDTGEASGVDSDWSSHSDWESSSTAGSDEPLRQKVQQSDAYVLRKVMARKERKRQEKLREKLPEVKAKRDRRRREKEAATAREAAAAAAEKATAEANAFEATREARVAEARFLRNIHMRAPRSLLVKWAGDCDGVYDISPLLTEHDYPLWQKRAASMWMYIGTDDKWIIGGTEERSKEFKCQSGVLASMGTAKPETGKTSGKKLPHEISFMGWARFEEASRRWLSEPSVQVLKHNPRHDLLASKLQAAFRGRQVRVGVCRLKFAPPKLLVAGGKEQQSGTYNLCKGIVNNMPQWKHFAKALWVYGSKDNRWMVGGEREQALDFDCSTGEIASAAPHYGGLPHRMPFGKWMRLSRSANGARGTEPGQDWLIDESIIVALNALITPEAFMVSSRVQMLGGEFFLQKGQLANHFPIWRSKTESDATIKWIYSSADGYWCMALADDETKFNPAKKSQVAVSSGPHGGLLPNEVRCWQRYHRDKDVLMEDQGLTIWDIAEWNKMSKEAAKSEFPSRTMDMLLKDMQARKDRQKLPPAAPSSGGALVGAPKSLWQVAQQAATLEARMLAQGERERKYLRVELDIIQRELRRMQDDMFSERYRERQELQQYMKDLQMAFDVQKVDLEEAAEARIKQAVTEALANAEALPPRVQKGKRTQASSSSASSSDSDSDSTSGSSVDSDFWTKKAENKLVPNRDYPSQRPPEPPLRVVQEEAHEPPPSVVQEDEPVKAPEEGPETKKPDVSYPVPTSTWIEQEEGSELGHKEQALLARYGRASTSSRGDPVEPRVTRKPTGRDEADGRGSPEEPRLGKSSSLRSDEAEIEGDREEPMLAKQAVFPDEADSEDDLLTRAECAEIELAAIQQSVELYMLRQKEEEEQRAARLADAEALSAEGELKRIEVYAQALQKQMNVAKAETAAARQRKEEMRLVKEQQARELQKQQVAAKARAEFVLRAKQRKETAIQKMRNKQRAIAVAEGLLKEDHDSDNDVFDLGSDQEDAKISRRIGPIAAAAASRCNVSLKKLEQWAEQNRLFDIRPGSGLSIADVKAFLDKSAAPIDYNDTGHDTAVGRLEKMKDPNIDAALTRLRSRKAWAPTCMRVPASSSGLALPTPPILSVPEGSSRAAADAALNATRLTDSARKAALPTQPPPASAVAPLQGLRRVGMKQDGAPSAKLARLTPPQLAQQTKADTPPQAAATAAEMSELVASRSSEHRTAVGGGGGVASSSAEAAVLPIRKEQSRSSGSSALWTSAEQ